MIQLDEAVKAAADANVREIISQLPIETQPMKSYFALGYCFEHKTGEAEKEGLLPCRIIGRSNKALILDLGEIDGIYFCARLPYFHGRGVWKSLITSEGPPTNIQDHIPALETILKGIIPGNHDVLIPICEDRVLNNPHPNLNPEYLDTLFGKTILEMTEAWKIENERRDVKEAQMEEIKRPEVVPVLPYTLMRDLSEGGRFQLYEIRIFYTFDYNVPRQRLEDFKDEGEAIFFNIKAFEIAAGIKGGMKELRRLCALHHDACSAIESKLISGEYSRRYADTLNHYYINHVIRSMFCLRVEKETGYADIVLHDPRNVLLAKND